VVVAHDPCVSHCQLDASRRRHGPATLTCKPKRNLRDAFAAACTLNPATRTPSATGRAGERCTTAGVDSTHTQASCCPRQLLRCSATPPRRHAAIRRGANNHAVAAAFLQVDGRRHPQLVSTLPLKHTPARARKQPRQRPSPPIHPHPRDLPSQPRFSSLPPHTKSRCSDRCLAACRVRTHQPPPSTCSDSWGHSTNEYRRPAVSASAAAHAAPSMS
jgi:hypothetical protein